MTYERLVEILRNSGESRRICAMDCVYKKSPDTPEGQLDVREAMIADADAADMEAHPDKYPQNMLDNESHLFVDPMAGKDYVVDGIPIGSLRAQMGWENVDLSSGVTVTELEVPAARTILVRVYTPEGARNDRPCMVFFHGGGFMGGSVDVVENPCKLIAQRADAVVVSVDYRLCPEHRFPDGLNDCYDVVCWVYDHGAKALGICPEKLAVGGDSAGGNLAAVCSLRDRDEGLHHIKYAALLYPTVMRTDGAEYEGYHWSVDMYNNPGKDKRIDAAVAGIGQMNPILNMAYLSAPDQIHHPYVAPLSAESFDGLPRTMIASAEYDFLLAEAGVYAKRLSLADVDVRWLVYGGVGHAFLDKLGFFPQAEDCIDEIVTDMRSL